MTMNRLASSLVCSSVLVLSARIRAQTGAARPGSEASWYARVSDDVRAGEYRYAPVGGEAGTWSAPNRSQELRSRVTPAGIEVFPRAVGASGAGAAWKLRLGTKSFGRTGFVQELARGDVSADGARIEVARGEIVERYENGPGGIEQSWTIASAPYGVEELWIGLAIGGDLSFRIDAGGRSGVFVDSCGDAVLRYRDLVVRDATGRELDARLQSSPEGVGISI